MPAKFDFSHLPGHVEHTPDYESDNLASADYKAASRLLTITFRSGRRYLFGPVAFTTVAALKQADKEGHGNEYFRKNVAPLMVRELKETK
jgi:KTSC domain